MIDAIRPSVRDPDTLARAMSPTEIDREALKAHYDAIFAGVSAAVRVRRPRCDAPATRAAMLAQAGGLPIRIASKSVRSTRGAAPDLRARSRAFTACSRSPRPRRFTSPSRASRTSWSPTRRSTAGRSPRSRGWRPRTRRARPVLMVDDRPHLDLIEGAIGGGRASHPGLPRRRRRLVATRRAHGADRAEALAGARAAPGATDGGRDRRAPRHRARRADGIRGPDRRGRRPARPGKPLRSAAIRAMQSRVRARHPLRGCLGSSPRCARSPPPRRARLRQRRRHRAASRAPRPPGSSPSSPPARASTPRRCSTTTARSSSSPAAFFCLPVVRRPVGGVATLLGGGYLASGAGERQTACPSPTSLAACASTAQEGAGEVQTPVTGAAAYKLRVGDRVYLRHAKAGELCERFDSLYLVEGEADRRRGADLPRRGQGVSLMARIDLDKSLAAPIDDVFELLTDHAVLHAVSRVQRRRSSLREGTPGRATAVGALRRLVAGAVELRRRRSRRSSGRRGMDYVIREVNLPARARRRHDRAPPRGTVVIRAHRLPSAARTASSDLSPPISGRIGRTRSEALGLAAAIQAGLQVRALDGTTSVNQESCR